MGAAFIRGTRTSGKGAKVNRQVEPIGTSPRPQLADDLFRRVPLLRHNLNSLSDPETA